MQFNSHPSDKNRAPSTFPADLQVAAVEANLKIRGLKMTTGAVTTCYSTRVAFDLQKNPTYPRLLLNRLDHVRKVLHRPLLRDRPPQRGNMNRQCTLKHFIIDSFPRFLDKRQRPISFRFS